MNIHLSEESKYFLNVLENLVSSNYDINILEHGKAIRDIMDNVEGHIYNCLNSKNRYDHSTLKYDSPNMSRNALEIRKTTTKSGFIKQTHREHAKPFKIILTEICGLKGNDLLEYVINNVRSVTITKDEQKMIDKEFKSTMPSSHIFSRFSHFEIEVVNRKTL